MAGQRAREASTDGIIHSQRTRIQPPRTLRTLGLTQKNWEDLEASRKVIPRFLFRAFGPWSGGGVDRRLNTTNGIVPHGFLNGKKPTNIYDIPDLGGMICGHLCGARVPSDFSSWAACFRVAANYAREGGYIAIIDTTLIADHAHIYHVPEFHKVGLAPDPYDHEYLAYGPINGVAFHCVKYQDLIDGGLKNIIQPFHVGWDIETMVSVAKRLATMFRPSRDGRPDIIIALTAIFASLGYNGRDSNPITLNWNILDKISIELASEILNLAASSGSSGVPALVNPRMYTERYPQLKQMVLMLQKVEGMVKLLHSADR